MWCTRVLRLAAIAVAASALAAEADRDPAIGRKQFFRAVEIGGLTEQELVHLVSRLGVSFQLTDADRNQLAKAGVKPAVIKAVESNFRPDAGRPEPRAEAPAQPVVEDVSEPRVLRQFRPTYPAEAMKKKLAGVVKVEVQVDAEGRAQQVRGIEGPSLLVTAAEDSVRRWVFEPARANGTARPGATTVSIHFQLPKE